LFDFTTGLKILTATKLVKTRLKPSLFER